MIALIWIFAGRDETGAPVIRDGGWKPLPQRESSSLLRPPLIPNFQ